MSVKFEDLFYIVAFSCPGKQIATLPQTMATACLSLWCTFLYLRSLGNLREQGRVSFRLVMALVNVPAFDHYAEN